MNIKETLEDIGITWDSSVSSDRSSTTYAVDGGIIEWEGPTEDGRWTITQHPDSAMEGKTLFWSEVRDELLSIYEIADKKTRRSG